MLMQSKTNTGNKSIIRGAAKIIKSKLKIQRIIENSELKILLGFT